MDSTRPAPAASAAPRALSADGRDLAERYLPMAIAVAREYEDAHGRDRDFRGACRLALCKAAAGFDPATHPRFAAYLTPWLHGACKRLLRDERARGYRFARAPHAEVRVVSLDLAGAGAEPSHDPTAELAERIDRAELVERAMSALLSLPRPLAEVVRGVDLAGEHAAAVGARLGLSRGRVGTLRREALRQLREVLG